MMWPAWLILSEQAHAEDVMDLWARFIDGLPAVLAAIATGTAAIVIARRGAARHAETAIRQEEQAVQQAEQAAALAEVREQVSNDHTTNLRVDIDELAAAVRRLGGKVDAVLARQDAHDEATRDMRATLAHVDERSARIGQEVTRNNLMRREEDARLRNQLAAVAEGLAEQQRIARLRHPDDMT